ncbi:MAG: hypothetical protein IID45_00285 [Planctomycetes bacterium]|nr:hypothetical protein [Planctomycetota bacterium]
MFHSRRWSVLLPYLADLPKVEETERQLSDYEKKESDHRRQGDEQNARDARAMAERCRRTLERIRPLPAGDRYPLCVEVRQMGDAFWVAVEGEPYWALKQQLQERFPQTTILVTVLSQAARCGYLPTREAYEKTTLYQVSVAVLAPGSLEILISAVAEQIESCLDRV